MKRLMMSIAALLCAAVSASAQSWAQARVQKSPRHLEWVTVKSGNREVKCFVGFPERKNNAPAVLVIHEIFGHTDWIQSVVDEFAAAGYIAIAPDLLSGMAPGGGGSPELGAGVGRVINTLPAAQINADLDAAATYVLKEPACNGKLVVVGFCWGGGKSFAYAIHNPNLAAALVFYGPAPKPEDMAAIKTPVYGFYGGNDARISSAVPKVTEQMKVAGKMYEPVIYEGAGHGFMRAGEDPTANETGSGDEARQRMNAANVKARDEAWTRIKTILAALTPGG